MMRGRSWDLYAECLSIWELCREWEDPVCLERRVEVNLKDLTQKPCRPLQRAEQYRALGVAKQSRESGLAQGGNEEKGETGRSKICFFKF